MAAPTQCGPMLQERATRFVVEAHKDRAPEARGCLPWASSTGGRPHSQHGLGPRQGQASAKDVLMLRVAKHKDVIQTVHHLRRTPVASRRTVLDGTSTRARRKR